MSKNYFQTVISKSVFTVKGSTFVSFFCQKVKRYWRIIKISPLSAPQDMIHVIKTRSRLRVRVGIVHFQLDFRYLFSWFYEKAQSVG